MEDKESVLIPRNVLNEYDKFPIDFIIKFNISTRQIPYILTGGITAASIIMFVPFSIIPKSIISMFIFGMNIAASDLKIEGEYFEKLFLKSIKYIVTKKRFDKRVKK